MTSPPSPDNLGFRRHPRRFLTKVRACEFSEIGLLCTGNSYHNHQQTTEKEHSFHFGVSFIMVCAQDVCDCAIETVYDIHRVAFTMPAE
jgi:hypothetical protein